MFTVKTTIKTLILLIPWIAFFNSFNTLLAEQITPPSFTHLPRSRCGNGVCDAKEKANPNLCPKDCEEIPSISEQDLEQGWYWGSKNQKKAGTPYGWAHSNEGTRSACWHKTEVICGQTYSRPASTPTTTQQPTCPQIMPPSPQLEERCEQDGGELEPKENEQGCVIGYECKKETSTPPITPTNSSENSP